MKDFDESTEKEPIAGNESGETLREQTEESTNEEQTEVRECESFEGDAPEAEKAKETFSIKAILVSLAMVMTVLTALSGEKARVKYVERHYDSLIEAASIKDEESDFDNSGEETPEEKEEAAELSEYEPEEDFVPLDPNEEFKLTVPFYSQKDYPTGCELVSTSMLLAKYGKKLTAEELVKKGYIKTKEVYLDRKEDAYGPDPNMTFVGDPLDDSGYGCYSGAIVKALKKIMPEDDYDIVDLTGKTLDEICYCYVDRGIPVLYWGSLRMDQLYYDVVNHWYLDEGKNKGEEFRWVSNEHCMVLIGHNKDNYIFNDPSVDKAGAEYIRPIVEKRFEQLGRQAVAIVPKKKNK